MLAAIGPGPVEGDERGDVVEARRAPASAGSGAWRAPSSWNTPTESARRSISSVGSSSRATASMSGRSPVVRFDEVERALDDRQVAQAQEVHLEQPEVLDPVHLVLGDDRRVLGLAAGVGLALDGQVVGQRVPGDHHRGGVDAVLAPQALEPERDIDDLLGVGVRRRAWPAARRRRRSPPRAPRSWSGRRAGGCRGP